ncbi:sodium/solute symporter [Botrimarina sp.]|uniref:sodium:solute symporter family transporter n=1 Tax=Botrimarina sp. TaxID=2795802 RepID=UPI0032F00482
MGTLDLLVFVAFIAAVVCVGLVKSREADGEKDSQDYFLAGRGLTWWLVGFSLIAANISTEQFVGMSGAAASHVGLAIASYEWLAAVTLVVVAFGFLPYFLRAGIFTMPQFLEYRYNRAARLIMAAATVLIYLLLLGAVTYSGALTVRTLGDKYGMAIPLWQPSLFIAVVAMVYVVAGGLKASVWADLLQGSALILGGAIVMWLALARLGAVEQAARVVDASTGEVAVQTLDPEAGPIERFFDLNANRMNMFLPASDPVLPWTALLLGVWIPNFYYWGLNQYITQRTLGSSSLAEGQKGIVFAAYLKLLIPFVVVVPGILAFNLFHEDMRVLARKDVAGAMAKYLKANPETDYVRTVEGLDSAEAAEHAGPAYLLALYDSDEQLAAFKKLKVTSPFVLPIRRDDFDKATPVGRQVFENREDLSWDEVNPELAAEIQAYNAGVRRAAAAAGVSPESQALVAYKYDTALGQLLDLLPRNGLFGFVMAALLGAVISSLAAMLNAASSIFTLDLVRGTVAPDASDRTLVLIGRLAVVAFATVACVLSPLLSDPDISNSVFTIIQKGQGLLSPGVLAVFVLGLLLRRAPRVCGVVGLVLNVIVYGGLWWISETTQLFQGIGFLNNFLNWMAISFAVCVAVIVALAKLAPLPEPIDFHAETSLDLTGSRGAWIAGLVAIGLTIALYATFSPLGVAGM